MSPTITSGFQPSSTIASAPPSTATSTGLKSRTYGRTMAQVALVARPARDNECMTVTEARAQQRQVDPFGQETALLAQVAHACCRRTPRGRPSPVLLLRKRAGELALAQRVTRGQASAVAEEARAADGQALAVGNLSKRSAPGRRSGAPRRGRAGAAPDSGSGRTGRHATFTTTRTPDSTSSSADTRSRSVWSMIAMSSRPGRLTSSFVRRPSRAVPVCSTRVLIAAWRGTRGRRASVRPRRAARRRRGDRCGCASDHPESSRRGNGASATLAIWGRCVIVITCARSARRRSVAATACAVSPPMPASISSKTSVSPPPTAASASATRDSSPPEALLGDRGRTGGRHSAGSGRRPRQRRWGPGSRSRSSTRNSPSPIPTPRNSRDRQPRTGRSPRRARCAARRGDRFNLASAAASASPAATAGSRPSASASSSFAGRRRTCEQLGVRGTRRSGASRRRSARARARPARCGPARRRARRGTPWRWDPVSRSRSATSRSSSAARESSGARRSRGASARSAVPASGSCALALFRRDRLGGGQRTLGELGDVTQPLSLGAQLVLGRRLEVPPLPRRAPRARAAAPALPPAPRNSSSCRLRAAPSSRQAAARLTSPAELLLAAEAVEHLELVRRPAEAALLELARHRDQPLGRGGGILSRDRASPRVRPRAAVSKDAPGRRRDSAEPNRARSPAQGRPGRTARRRRRSPRADRARPRRRPPGRAAPIAAGSPSPRAEARRPARGRHPRPGRGAAARGEGRPGCDRRGRPEAYVEAELDLPEGFFDDDELSGLADLAPEDEPG